MTGAERARATATAIQPLDLAQVPGAVSVQVSHEEVPDGVGVTTTYFAADGSLLRQDQNFVVNPDKFQLFAQSGM